MGSYIAKQVDKTMKKSQDFMLENQAIMLERQIQMQNQMRERMMATQIARARDMVMFYGSFYGVAFFGLIAGFRKTKNAAPLAALVPLSFVLGYQMDMAYGSKLHRIRAEADRILDDEQLLLEMPHGIPSLASIELARQKQRDFERLRQDHDIYL